MIRKGSREPSAASVGNQQVSPNIYSDHNAVIYKFPHDVSKIKKLSIRHTGGHASVFGQNASFSSIPATIQEATIQEATIQETSANRSAPAEKESICVNFRVNKTRPKRSDSVYWALGNAPDHTQVWAFDVFTRISGLKNKNHIPWVTLRFSR